MKLHRLTLRNFRSFKDEQTFTFPEEPGLYFVQGSNEVEARLEANGAGKTTMWEALTWLLFGKTSRGLKAGDVCNWDAGKGTMVSLEFTSPSGEDCAVTRTWKPNSWILSWPASPGVVEDLTKSPENAVLGWLCLEFAPFLNSILMSQGQPMFLDLKHDAKAALFSEVMGLDCWLEYSSKASKAASAQDSVSRVLERDLALLRGKLSGIQGSDLDRDQDSWHAAQGAKLAAIEQNYERSLKKLDQCRQVQVEQIDKTAEFRLAVQEAVGHYEDARKLLDEHAPVVSAARYQDEGAARELKQAKKINSELKAGHCPTCGGSTRGHRGHSLTELERNAADRMKELDRCLERWSSLEALERKAKMVLDRAREDLADAGHLLKNSLRDIQMEERNLDWLEEQAEQLGNEVNPYEKMLADRKQAGAQLSEDIRSKVRLLDDSNSAFSVKSFWVRGFKELRLQLIAEALNELELEVNSCVTSLGLVDWELSFQVDRETKGGSIQRGFNVVVKSPHNSAGVPWESWSGGEAQRLRVAATMGLANLIRSRSGTMLDLECWDEPSTGLSQQGVRDLLEALAARARVEQRTIFMVDHTAHSFGGFAGSVHITKTEQGSVIKSSWSSDQKEQ